MYLYLYLCSSAGLQGLKRLTKGTTIPHVSAQDLAQLPIVLPELSKQARIVGQALEIKKTASTLQSLVSDANQSLADNFFDLDTTQNKLRQFSAETDKAFYQTLPFPIAIVHRKLAYAPNGTQRFSLLIDLFEAVIRFIVLVQVADTLSGAQQTEVLTSIPELAKLSKPSLGTWASLFRALAGFQASNSFLKELTTLKVEEDQRTIDEFIKLRNESFKGHGTTLSDDVYESRFQEHAPAIYELVHKMSFLANYRLMKTGPMEKDGGFYRITYQSLMGDNPVFRTQVLSSRAPLDSNKVLYVDPSLEPVALEPFIILEPCTECHRLELLLLDKFSDKKITYLGYESGHKPSYQNVNLLPLTLREAAASIAFKH